MLHGRQTSHSAQVRSGLDFKILLRDNRIIPRYVLRAEGFQGIAFALAPNKKQTMNTSRNLSSSLKSTFSLLAVAMLMAAPAEPQAASISLSLSNRRVDASANDNGLIDSDSVFDSNLGNFSESVSASSGAASSSAEQDSDITLTVGDILSVSGQGAASASSPGTVQVNSESESNIFVEFNLSDPAPFSFSATTTLGGIGGATAYLINLVTSTIVVGSFGSDSASLSGMLVAGDTYQLIATANAGQASGTATWDLNFVVGAAPSVPDGGSSGILMALATLGLAVIRRHAK
jgi:hypothetical protein